MPPSYNAAELREIGKKLPMRFRERDVFDSASMRGDVTIMRQCIARVLAENVMNKPDQSAGAMEIFAAIGISYAEAQRMRAEDERKHFLGRKA